VTDLSDALTGYSGLLVHLAALCQILGFLMRDQIWLRALVLTGNALYAVYYFVYPATPLWDAMFWSGTMLLANAVMIVVILRDRRMQDLSDDKLSVFQAFGNMVPGDFRRLMEIARVHTVGRPTILTRLDTPPVRLFYVIDGTLEIRRRDRDMTVKAAGQFIAEIGFLLGTPATATVTLAPGGRYIEWDRARLDTLLARRPAIRLAIEQAMNRDLARKLAAPWRGEEPERTAS
jgi:hypothetical protein